jgi:hypothetical protein
MDDDLELLDDRFDDCFDDIVFEPNEWDMAMAIGIGVDLETDRDALDELADAMLVWLHGPELERLTDAAVERLWSEELQQLIHDGLVRLGEKDDWRTGVAAALAAFEREPRRAEVTREVVRHLAMQLGQEDTPIFFCLDCLNEAVSAAPRGARRGLAVRVAIVAARNAGGRDGTREQRRAVRGRLGRLGELARTSMPSLAAELRTLAAEPLPDRPEDDEVWSVAYAALHAKEVRPELN